MIDVALKEIKQVLMSSDRKYYELDKNTLWYLINNLQRYRNIEKTMQERYNK